ncbi:MAG: LysM peptidoglycan-binding domain-containing protein [Bacteroidales bacterium]|nr:LysM peptidoglycan-binding domain-containing protein [Bacteroidales bacterium]
MVKNLLQPLLPVLFMLAVPAGLFSQVKVERSDDKVIIGGEYYYIHVVDSLQTLYSISKAYNVDIEDITRENPPAVYGLRIGQALKIPVREERETKPEKDHERFVYHVLQQGESIYSLSSKYDIPQDKIIAANPGLDIYDMPVGTELAIPRKQFRQEPEYFKTDEPGIILHDVKKGENYASLSRRYNVSIRDIRRVNRGLLFPREGEVLRIPHVTQDTLAVEIRDDSVSFSDERLTYLFSGRKVEYTDIGDLEGEVSVTLMLPLMLDKNSKRTYIDSSEYDRSGEKIYKLVQRPDEWIYPRSEIYIEFYEGALLAVNKLADKGLDVQLQVFDTMRDSLRVHRFLETGRLRNTDLIIGPVYPGNMDQVARYARRYRIPLVSPLARENNKVLRTNPYLFKIQPSRDAVQDALAEEISNYYDHNLIFVHTDTAYSSDLSLGFRDKIYRRLRLKVPFDDISMKEVFFSSRSSYNDTIDILDHAMTGERPNLVILASDDESVMSEVIVSTHALLRKYDVKLIGYPGIRWLDNLDPMYFYELGIMIYTPNWVDYGQEDVKEFLAKYREYFKMEPPVRSYAWQSYDMMYYFLSGIALHGSEFMYRPSVHEPDLLQVDYDFQRTGLMNGFENNRLYLIRYSPGLEVEFLNSTGRRE